MKFTVVTNNKDHAKFIFYVHKAGCNGIKLEKKKFFGHTWDIEAVTGENAIAKALTEYGLADQGYARQSFLLSKCLK